MLKIFTSLLILLMILVSANAQDCKSESLVQKPGIWKASPKGSESGTATELAREKNTIASIHKMIQAKYTPTAVQANYHGAYSAAYPNSTGNSYTYSIIPLNYYCDGNTIKVEHETPSYFSITANLFTTEIYESPNISEASSGIGYHFIYDMPVAKDGYWQFKQRQEGFGYTPTRTYSWLVTYDGKLPFAYVTKKEFLEARKVILTNAMKQSGRQFSDVLKNLEIEKGYKEKEYKNDPEKLKHYMKMDYNDSKARYQKLLSDNEKNYKPAFNKIETLLKMPEDELNQPAIVKMDPNDGNSYVFVDGNDPLGQVPIKPNPAYFNKNLPRSSPQFFSVSVRGNYMEPISTKFMADIIKAINFMTLKNMLGK